MAVGGERESSSSGNQNEGCSSLEKEARRRMTKHSPHDICPLNGISSTEQSNQTAMRSQSKREPERGRKTQVRRQGKEREKRGSKAEKSDRTGRAVPARHCFTSHCTEEENLSYDSAYYIAFTIYVPARIMQLDGSVEKTPINLILFSDFFPSLSFSFSTPLILSVCVLWHSSALVYFLTSYVKGIPPASLCLMYILYSAELVELVNTKSTHTKTHPSCLSYKESQHTQALNYSFLRGNGFT